MKKSLIFCVCLLLLGSCKTKENSKSNGSDENFTNNNKLREIRGKVVDVKGKSIAFVAVKLYLDENDCMNAYTDDEGNFDFKVGELRIKDQSHFEAVYKGYAINFLSLRNFEENKPIVLSKKGELVSVTDYRVFYESIKSCSR